MKLKELLEKYYKHKKENEWSESVSFSYDESSDWYFATERLLEQEVNTTFSVCESSK